MNTNAYTQKRKIVTKVILGITYMAFLGYLLAKLQWIADWNYSIHELLYIPYSITFYSLPVLLVLWMYYAIKSKRELKASNKKPRIKKILINSSLTASLFIIGAYFYIQSMTVSTGGLFKVERKVQERNNYYIELNQKKIKCTHSEFNLIEEGKVYLVTFDWNKKLLDEGKLILIEPTGVIFD